MSDPLLFERDGPVAILTFNRPASRNAISPELACRFADHIGELAHDPDVRAVILTGKGNEAFCSGGDLKLTLPLLSGAREPENDYDRRYLDDPDVFERLTLRRFAMPKPVIAAVNGPCMAAGMEILLGTDIRIAVPHARFALPEAARGVIPFAGALARLPRQIPYSIAMEMMVANEALSAERALQHGLINKIVSPDQLMDAALEMGHRIARHAPVSVAEIKQTVQTSMGRTLSDGFDLEDAARERVMATEDAREGPRAFMEKRPPMYRGR